MKPLLFLTFYTVLISPKLLAQQLTKFQYDIKRNQVATTYSGTCTATNSVSVCLSLQSGAWHDANIWSCGHVPTIIDFVIIAPLTKVTISINNAQARKIIFLTESTIIYSNAGAKLLIKGG